MEFSIEEFNAPSKSFKHNYKKICKIGNGAFGKVYKAKELKTDNIVAVKQISINNSEINNEYILKEINVLKNLSHPNIVKYYKYYEENERIYIIMEYLEGGTLKEFINNEKNKINEDISRIIVGQILNALSYLHYNCDICHRDIKPENIMFRYKDNLKSIKLIDFGLSSNSFEKKNYLNNCGTLIYMAPEQISNKIYSKSVDIWSVGIILYMLLNNGKNPFYIKGESREKIIQKIRTKKIEFDDKNYPISDMGKDFINKLLMKNSSSRYTARPALNHPWVTLHKFEEIPLTVLDKLLIGEHVNTIKELFLTALFMNYYKNNNLKMTFKTPSNTNSFENSLRKNYYTSYSNIRRNNFNILRNEINKLNFKNFDLEEYFQRVKKSNLLLEKKFKENREIMFMTKKTINTNESTNMNKEIKTNNISEIKNNEHINEQSSIIFSNKRRKNTIYYIKNNSNLNSNRISKRIINNYNYKKMNSQNFNNNYEDKKSRNKIKDIISSSPINNNQKFIEIKKDITGIKNESMTLQDFLNKEKNIHSLSQFNKIFITDNYEEINIYTKNNLRKTKDNFSNRLLNYKVLLKGHKNQKLKLTKKNSCLIMNDHKNFNLLKNYSHNKKISKKNKNKSVDSINSLVFNRDSLRKRKIAEEGKSININRYNYYYPQDEVHKAYISSNIKKTNTNFIINNNIYNICNLENGIKSKKILFEIKGKLLPKIMKNNN